MNEQEIYQEAIDFVKSDLIKIHNIVIFRNDFFYCMKEYCTLPPHKWGTGNSYTGHSPYIVQLTFDHERDVFLRKYANLIHQLPDELKKLILNKFTSIIEYKDDYWIDNRGQYFRELKKAYELLAINDPENPLTFEILAKVYMKKKYKKNPYLEKMKDLKVLFNNGYISNDLSILKDIETSLKADVEVFQQLPDFLKTFIKNYLIRGENSPTMYKYAKLLEMATNYKLGIYTEERLKKELMKLDGGKYYHKIVEIIGNQQQLDI